MTQEALPEDIRVLVTHKVHQTKLVINDQKDRIVLVETLVLESRFYSALLVKVFHFIRKKVRNYLQPRQR